LNILVVSQYFWPENFRVNNLVEELILNGHNVTVLTGEPNYPEGQIYKSYIRNKSRFKKYKGALIIRVPIIARGKNFFTLFLNYLTFCFTASFLAPFYLRKHKFEKIFVYQTSPVTVAIPAIILKYLKNATLMMWVLDIWPDSLKSVGLIKSKKLLSILNFFVNKIYYFCDYIFVQSEGFKKKISQSFDKNRIFYFPGWSEIKFDLNEINSALEFKKRNFTVLFAGNIGVAQDFESIFKAMLLLKNKDIHWLILGNGRQFNWFKDKIYLEGLQNKVFLMGSYPIEKMPSFFKHADGLLITLRKDPIYKITVPAKFQTYLQAGKPLLGMIDGEVHQYIKKYNLGYACEAGNYKGLVEIILRLYRCSKKEVNAISKNNLQISEKVFNKKSMIELIEKLN
jgi:colanic acid biosynthesis glycosyl transferase WcaI